MDAPIRQSPAAGSSWPGQRTEAYPGGGRHLEDQLGRPGH